MSTTPKPNWKAPALRLIDAAEILIGEHGLDGVSLLQIAKQAGQANKYAVQYHFGTREKLVRAVFEARLERIGARRQQMLDAVADGASVRDLIAAFIYPVYAEVSADGLHHYARFAARVLDSPLAQETWFKAQNFTTSTQLREMLAALTPHLPAPEFYLRLTLASELLMRALAVIDRSKIAQATGNALAGAPLTTDEYVLETAIDIATSAFTRSAD